MKKELDTNTVLNELKASSVFFRQPEPATSAGPSTSSPTQNSQASQPGVSAKHAQKPYAEDQGSTSSQGKTRANSQASKQPRKQASLQERNQETIEDSILAALAITPIKPNTFRYSIQELDFIRDVVYEAEVKHQTKLDKNDVARIALEWLMYDHQEKGKDGLLVRILASKKASM